MKYILAVLAIGSLAACASRPDAIPAVSMSGAYNDISCSRAQELLNSERQNLASLSQQQNNAATGDAIGVFLLGVPMSSVGGGDKAGEIGSSKGKINALESRLVSC